MDFGIRRLPPFEEDHRYHLFDDQGQLILVADYGSPWLPVDSLQQVRFARPDGNLIATLDLPHSRQIDGRPERVTSYAIIFDYAVYAIINRINSSIDVLEKNRRYFTLEVEGQTWLILPKGDESGTYELYNRLSPGFSRHIEPETTNLLDPAAIIQEQVEDFNYIATIPIRELKQRELVVLALVFLIDSM